MFAWLWIWFMILSGRLRQGDGFTYARPPWLDG